MIKPHVVNLLKNSRNLLAFSAGVDSSALFFLLLQNNIEFDIAIVDYNLRGASKIEVAHANELAKQYQKTIFVKSVVIDGGNFESNARDARYSFFEELIFEFGYDRLITAHQLNDKVEWMLMRFCSGAGLVSMVGMSEIDKRESYEIIRPLIDVDRPSIKKYLAENSIKYFEDESNCDERYKRNYFRANFSNRLVEEFGEGIRKSFEILDSEKEAIYGQCKFFEYKELLVCMPKAELQLVYMLDVCLKKLGYLATKAQKSEFLITNDCVVGGKFCAVFDGGYLYVTPFITNTMPKQFKEQCRQQKIPPKVRGYLQQLAVDPLVIRRSIGLFFDT